MFQIVNTNPPKEEKYNYLYRYFEILIDRDDLDNFDIIVYI